jgi:hypothetical protein
VSDTVSTGPDEELLEFLGGIDEISGESPDGDFLDFLARTDIERVTSPEPSASARDDDRE